MTLPMKRRKEGTKNQKDKSLFPVQPGPTYAQPNMTYYRVSSSVPAVPSTPSIVVNATNWFYFQRQGRGKGRNLENMITDWRDMVAKFNMDREGQEKVLLNLRTNYGYPFTDEEMHKLLTVPPKPPVPIVMPPVEFDEEELAENALIDKAIKDYAIKHGVPLDKVPILDVEKKLEKKWKEEVGEVLPPVIGSQKKVPMHKKPVIQRGLITLKNNANLPDKTVQMINRASGWLNDWGRYKGDIIVENPDRTPRVVDNKRMVHLCTLRGEFKLGIGYSEFGDAVNIGEFFTKALGSGRHKASASAGRIDIWLVEKE